MKNANVKDPPFPRNYSSELLVFVRGDGAWLTDRAGKKYLDFGGGIAVNALGYGRRDLARTAAEQMEKLIHVSNLYTTEPALELAAKLVESGPFEAVHFGNSGSEANETALKYARLYAFRTRGEGHHKILCFAGGFHGRTLGALSCTFNPKYQDPFKPLIPGVEACTFNDSGELENLLDAGYAAVIVEVVQGEGGLSVMEREFAAVLEKRCREHDIVLIVDEVQTGLARTGSLYAYETVGLKPDIITLAKPLAAGLPLSATLIPQRINELLHVGEHGTTFGGGPVTTAVALKVWQTLSDPAFISQVAEKGLFLEGELRKLGEKYSFLGQVKGKGLLRGIEVRDLDIAALMKKIQDAGLLVLRSGENVLRLAPPLNISRDELSRGIGILDQVFKST
ncbi:MAG TPA: acetylornithine/succinylornithine family transaminase [Spirochaetia bacterium]|nr:acetylornithine/succinylornithine family transaminase [Spirochaetia bacterium]